jgi:4-amino-4-deoxy-L-arabinose transferase-like glycosyltransferase
VLPEIGVPSPWRTAIVNRFKLRSFSPVVLALVGFLAVLTVALRLYDLNANGLWVDEIFTALFAAPQKTLAEVAQGPLNTPLPTPPLWFWITHAFQALFGVQDFVVRLPAIIAGCLGVLAMYLAARALFNRTVGLVSALLLTVSPLHIYVSREARFYPAIVGLSLLSLYFLHRAIEGRGQIRWWLGFTIVTLLNLYTHLTAFFVLAAEVAYAASLLMYLGWREAQTTIRAAKPLRRTPGREKSPRFALNDMVVTIRTMWQGPVARRWLGNSFFWPALLSLVAVGLCYLPMVRFLLLGVQGDRGLGNPGELVGLTFSFNFVLGMLTDLGAGKGLPLSLYGAAALVGCAAAWRRTPRQTALLGFLAVMPFVLLFVLRPKHWFSIKYAIFLLPVFLIAVAFGLVYLARAMAVLLGPALSSRWRGILTKATLLVLVALYVALNVLALDVAYGRRPDRWREIGQVLTHNVGPDDAVVTLPTKIRTMSSTQILAYYGPSAEQVTIIEAESLDQLQAAVSRYHRVWVLVDRPELERSAGLLAWLSAHSPATGAGGQRDPNEHPLHGRGPDARGAFAGSRRVHLPDSQRTWGTGRSVPTGAKTC